jgi:hypothetical protein
MGANTTAFAVIEINLQLIFRFINRTFRTYEEAAKAMNAFVMVDNRAECTHTGIDTDNMC